MLDLTNFILNSASFIEPSENTAELPESVQPIELNDDTVDKDRIVDPSSFFMMFAEIMAQTPDKNDTHVNSTVIGSSTQGINTEITNTVAAEDETVMDGRLMESDIKNTDFIQTSSDQSSTDNQLINTEPHTDGKQNIINNSINNGSLENEAQFPGLENNIAMAWINSDNFIPPLSASIATDIDQELMPELEALLAQPNELIEKALIKESQQQNYKESDIVENNAHLISNEDTFIDDILANEQQSNAIPSFSIQKMEGSGITQEVKLEGLPLENSQAIIQPQSPLNSSIQSSMETPAAKSLDISIDINNSQWADKFSEHIVWLGSQGIKSALIKINPEDLGPLEISIKVVKDSATVTINSHSSHVCAIVDQALPKLREMMAEQGLDLSEVHIGSGDDSRQFSQNDNRPEERGLVDAEEESLMVPAGKKNQEGLIDYFA